MRPPVAVGMRILLHRLGVAAVRLGKPHDQIEPPLVLADLPHRHSPDGLHQFEDVLGRHAVAGDGILVDPDLQDRLPGDLLDVDVGVARNGADDLAHLRRRRPGGPPGRRRRS